MSSQLASLLIMILVNNSLALPNYFKDGLNFENKQNVSKFNKMYNPISPEGSRSKRSFTTFSITRPLSKLLIIIIIRQNHLFQLPRILYWKHYSNWRPIHQKHHRKWWVILSLIYIYNQRGKNQCSNWFRISKRI